MSTLREKIQWLGLFIGPLAALTVFLTLPEQYQGPDGSLADFARAG
ncbi:MAG: hypothetical protein ACI9OD_001628, partial [Limisphaerales bacterium]